MSKKKTKTEEGELPLKPRTLKPRERELPDIIDAYMLATENTEPPKSYHLWTILSCLSAALQRRCVLNWFTIRIFPNLYVAIVGPPGATRKGTALSFGRELLEKADIRRAADTTTREAFIGALERSRDVFVDPASGRPVEHCSLSVFSSELTVLLGQRNSQFLDDLTDLFDCLGKFEYETKNNGTNLINNVWLSIIGATTQGALRESLPDHAFSGGFFSRFILISETERYKTVPKPGRTEEEQSLWLAVNRDFRRVTELAGEFTWSDRFDEAYETWYVDSSENPPFSDAKLDAYLSRRPLHLWKLSMISSVSRSNDLHLTLYDFERAKKWLENAEKNMSKAFNGVGKNQLASIVQSVLGYVCSRRVTTVSEILQAHYDDADYETMEKIIDTIVAIKAVSIKRSSQFEASVVTWLGGHEQKQGVIKDEEIS